MKLFYFDIYGRGEPIRAVLHHAKAEYEDVRLTHEELNSKKKEFEFG